MNIAVCISGEPREFTFFENSINSFKKLCDDNNITLHVFYHLWDHITRRQRNFNSQEPVLQAFREEDIVNKIPVTSGIFENKDSLSEDINYIWDYICNLQEKAPRYEDKKTLQKQIYYTNSPGYSQLASICKSNLIRLEYEKANNIQYDLVIRTRTDVEFTCKNILHLTNLMENETFNKKIYFPEIEVWNVKNELQVIPEFCFFLSNSNILNENIFNDYCKKITKDMFFYNNIRKNVGIRNDHTVFVNLILHNIKIKIQSNIRNTFKYKIHQLSNEYSKDVRTKYSHY